MAGAAAATYSKSAIDRAGLVLREWYMNPNRAMRRDPEVVAAMMLLAFDFRPTFQTPLDKVTMGMRSMLKTVSANVPGPGGRIPVGQRLKREGPIIDKLARYPKMKLSRMQDVGGCRLVAPGGRSEVQGVLRRIEKKKWDVRNLKDYVEEPTKHGYRAIHVVVMRDERLIEVQLRTPVQNRWAVEVDRASRRLRQPLKFGVGEPDLLRYFERAAYGLACVEAGEPPHEGFAEEIEEAREKIRPYFERRA